MHAKSVAAVALLAGLAVATPVKVHKRGTFTVNQVVAPRQRTLRGAEHIVRAFNKYHAEAPSHVQAAADSASTGEVTANSQNGDEQYTCQVQVGNTQMNLDFDTGSADLWVISDQLDSSETSGHAVYDTSSGSVENGESWNITYGDGSGASGVVYADTVVIGGVTATSQAVEAATSISSSFVQDPSDGLVGLAFSSINTVTPDQATTFFDTVSSSLASALFTARLKKGEPGTYDFGYIDSSKYTGSLSYTPVDNSQGFWGFTPDSYTVGTTAGQATIGSAIADTGTTLMLLGDDVVSDYYSQVSGAQNDQSAGGYTFDCSADLPDFILSVGGGTVTVPGSYINFQTASGNTCFGGLQSNSGLGISIFGDIFLKAAFVVFDNSQSSPQLGFAQGA